MKSVFCHFTPQQDNIQVKMFVCKLSKMLSVKAKRSCATLLLAAIMTCVNASQRSIHLDSAGHYNGVVIGFSNDFTADSSNRETMVVSIMVSVGPRTPVCLLHHDTNNVTNII